QQQPSLFNDLLQPQNQQNNPLMNTTQNSPFNNNPSFGLFNIDHTSPTQTQEVPTSLTKKMESFNPFAQDINPFEQNVNNHNNPTPSMDQNNMSFANNDQSLFRSNDFSSSKVNDHQRNVSNPFENRM